MTTTNLTVEEAVQKRFEHSLCVSMGKAFEWAATQRNWNLLDFIPKALRSRAWNEFEDDYTVFSQSPGYFLEIVADENTASPIASDGEWTGEGMADAAYWIGYTLMHWHIRDGISGNEIAENYDIRHILCAYDPWHTVSCDVAIDLIKKAATSEK